jgi:5-formyltetrahydrofolate cyclo-ligase
MEEIRAQKIEIRNEMIDTLDSLVEENREQMTRQIEGRLFDFANFLEANIVLLYSSRPHAVETRTIIHRCFDFGKMVILPVFSETSGDYTLYKVDHPKQDLKKGSDGVLEPDPARCKAVPIDCIDIAIVPGIAFDEKGGRIGPGDGTYDRLIPNLPVTTRKVSLAFEDQVVPLIPMESHDKHVDIIITDRRIIYKI